MELLPSDEQRRATAIETFHQLDVRGTLIADLIGTYVFNFAMLDESGSNPTDAIRKNLTELSELLRGSAALPESIRSYFSTAAGGPFITFGGIDATSAHAVAFEAFSL